MLLGLLRAGHGRKSVWSQSTEVHSVRCRGALLPASQSVVMLDGSVRDPTSRSDRLGPMSDDAKKLYVRFSFTDGGTFDLKLYYEADALSVFQRTLQDWEAGKDVAIRRLDDEDERGGWVNAEVAGISLLSADEILASD
jgi:hypothetical protein